MNFLQDTNAAFQPVDKCGCQLACTTRCKSASSLAMRLASHFIRCLFALALAFAAPAFASAPAQAAPVAIEAQHDHHAAVQVAPAQFAPDCGHGGTGGSHHLSPDCAICCWALAAPPVAPHVARAISRLGHPVLFSVFDGLNPPPPAPPPRG